MKTQIFILSIMMCFGIDALYAQVSKQNRYVVISFERRRVPSIDGNGFYHWIIPVDSIETKTTNAGEFKLSPIVLDATAQNIKDCINGKNIDLYTITTQTSFENDSLQVAASKSLVKIIAEHKIKLQTIKRMWSGKQWETVKVYATPVVGAFCDCLQFNSRGVDSRGNGPVFLPLSGFLFDDEFLISAVFNKNIKHADYSYIDYSALTFYSDSKVRTNFLKNKDK